MNFLFLFLDGVGLGGDDPHVNPFASVEMPTLTKLLGGKRLLDGVAPLTNQRSTLLALDACLGVPGRPQSATGQAALLTGQNIPALLGYHFGPKPNPEITRIVENGSLFRSLREAGLRVSFLNAYPPRYFESIQSGRRLYAAIPLAAVRAGLPLMTLEDLINRKAISADFTARGWRQHLGLTDTPLLTPFQAGERLAKLASENDFSLFEYWLSDYAGHGQDMTVAWDLLATFDQVLSGLIANWNDEAGLILITSDHGNMEDLGTRSHTLNRVPALVIGAPPLRAAFTAKLNDITDIHPAILNFFGLPS